MVQLVAILFTVLAVLLTAIAFRLWLKLRNYVSIAHIPGPPSHSYMLGESTTNSVCVWVKPTCTPCSKVTWENGSKLQLVKLILDGSVNLGMLCESKEYWGYIFLLSFEKAPILTFMFLFKKAR